MSRRRRLTPWLVDRFADRMDRYIMSLHDSEDIGENASELVCFSHPELEPWPCDDWFRACARIAARRHEPHRGGGDG